METITTKLPNGKPVTYQIVNGTAYRVDTAPEVVSWLETARQRNARVRVFYGDTDTPDYEEVHGHKPEPGKDWGEEYDTCGRIGRSTGSIKIPLMISNSRSYGGGGLLDDCIVRLYVNGREVYRHPSYHQPEYTIGQPPEKIGNVTLADEGYTTGVYANGDNVANFKSEKSAKRFVDFMVGKRMAK